MSKKANPTKILGKHPLWQSLLRASCLSTAVPYAALGGLGF